MLGVLQYAMGIGGSKKKQSKVLVVGLDGSGKSTLINNLKPENKKVNETFATVGFSVEKLAWTAGNVDFTMYDMSGMYHITLSHSFISTASLHLLLRSSAPPIHTSQKLTAFCF